MSDWHYGVIATLLAYPLWATWVSGNKIKVFQRGVIEPFVLAFLGCIGVIIGAIVSKNWNVFVTILSLLFGLALIVMIVKGVRGTLGAEEESDEG